MRNYLLFLGILAVLLVYFMGGDAIAIPYFISRTFLRMIAAYAISLVFSISLGIFIAHHRKAYTILFPILDILQSIPILAFLPFAVIFLIEGAPILGDELATVFLIFTSMTWAILFNVIEGVKVIPNTIKDVAHLSNLRGLRYLFHVLLPGIYPQVVSGSMTAWGGGWYFLVVGEYMIFGDHVYSLPGVGSFIAQSAYSGNLVYSLLGIGILAALVLGINRFVWQPLLMRTYKYRYDQYGDEIMGKEKGMVLFLDKKYDSVKFFLMDRFQGIGETVLKALSVDPSREKGKASEPIVYTVVLFLLVIIPLLLLLFYFKTDLVDGWTLLYYSGRTLSRMIIAYTIALVWTLGVAIWIGRNRKLLKMFMPIFDVGQSIPAVAVFPIIVVVVIHFFGGGIGIEIASILLLLTGMQWYLLFNLIRGMQTIPADILELSSIFKLNNLKRIKHIVLPALLPAIAAGSIEAFGGGLNATIVSERIIYDNQLYYTDGLGNLLQVAASVEPPDMVALFSCIFAMMIIVISINKFVWRRILKIAEGYKF